MHGKVDWIVSEAYQDYYKSEARKEELVQIKRRMRENNPMKRPEIAAKAKGNTHGRANKGRTVSPEWRAKLSAASKAAWARKKANVD